MQKKWRQRIERAEHEARAARSVGPMDRLLLNDWAERLERVERTGDVAELRREMARLTREVAELHHRLLEHDDPVPVQTPNGLDMVKRLDIYRGETPWGDRIEEVRAVNRRATTYVTLAPEAAVEDA